MEPGISQCVLIYQLCIFSS